MHMGEKMSDVSALAYFPIFLLGVGCIITAVLHFCKTPKVGRGYKHLIGEILFVCLGILLLYSSL